LRLINAQYLNRWISYPRDDRDFIRHDCDRAVHSSRIRRRDTNRHPCRAIRHDQTSLGAVAARTRVAKRCTRWCRPSSLRRCSENR